jgi:hypothetical protein
MARHTDEKPKRSPSGEKGSLFAQRQELAYKMILPRSRGAQ